MDAGLLAADAGARWHVHQRREGSAQAARKRKQVENAPKKGREAKLEELANKTSNLRAVAKSPPSDWSVDRRREDVD